MIVGRLSSCRAAIWSGAVGATQTGRPGYTLRQLRLACDGRGGLLVRARSAWARAAHLKFLLVTLALAAVVTTELVTLAAREYDKDYYFDEMWRADLARTPDFVQR